MTTGPRHRIPPDWEPNESCWLAWPSHEQLWGDALASAQRAITELALGVDGEQVELLVLDEQGAEAVARALGRRAHSTHVIPFGDIWLRDTGPIFAHDADGTLLATVPTFNGWGGRYLLEHDDAVALRIAETIGCPVVPLDLVAEGGAIEVDGAGTLITTRDCLLNPNRNPQLSAGDVEDALRQLYDIDTVVWLRRGLHNDHTDGHVDTLARFCAPGVVMCAAPSTGDPNAEALTEVIDDLTDARGGDGSRLEVVTVPSPGAVHDPQGELLPASYLNFYVSNGSIVVPTYGVANDEPALRCIDEAFPGRRVVGVDCRALLRGGGTLHCVSCQQPRAKESSHE